MSTAERAKNIAEGNYYAAGYRAMQETNDRYGTDQILALQETYLKRFADSYHGKLVIALFNDTNDSAIDALLERFAAARPNTFIYRALPPIRTMEGVWPDGHPNPMGHRLVAGSLFGYLVSEKLIPCR
jgi:hypothetical protein